MITITINTDNAAFEGWHKVAEVARILHRLADAIGTGGHVSPTLRDVNGNAVGTVTDTDEENS